MAESGADVFFAPVALEYSGVQSGRPVRGGAAQWQSYADAVNHILGRGCALIPWSCIDSDLTIGATQTLRFRVLPRYQATHRMWQITLSVASAGGRSFGTFTDPSGGTTAYSMGGELVRTISHLETISARTASESTLAPTFSLDAASTKTARVVGIACFESPRPELALDTNERGVNRSLLAQGREISAGSTGVSLGGVASGVLAAETVVQRNGLFHWAVDTSGAKSTTSAGYTRVFTLGADPLLLGMQLYRGATTRAVKCRAYARSGAGTTGNIRFTMSSGASLVLAVTAGMGATWLSGNLAIDCDDFTTSHGARRSPGDKCVIEWQRTGGANSVFLESIGILGG